LIDIYQWACILTVAHIRGYATPINQTPWQSGYSVSFKIFLTVERILGYASMITLVPVWAGNIVLGSSLFLVNEKFPKKIPRVKDRLTIYISLFVFIPTFMYITTSKIPFKWLASTAELFLVALLSSAAAFVAFSSLSDYTKGSWDKYAVLFPIPAYCFFLLADPQRYPLRRILM